MREDINLDRRSFLGKAALTVVATELGMLRPATALKPASPKHTSFASLKQVDVGVLNIGYAEDGPADGHRVANGGRSG